MTPASSSRDRPRARLAALERMLALLERRAMSEAPDPRWDAQALTLLVALATAASDPRAAS